MGNNKPDPNRCRCARPLVFIGKARFCEACNRSALELARERMLAKVRKAADRDPKLDWEAL